MSLTLEVDETGSTFLENACLKAVQQAQFHKMFAIGEDSGLCVDALQGAPGIYSARFSGSTATDQSNNELLLEKMKSIPIEKRTAHYVSSIALASRRGRSWPTADGRCHGRILETRVESADLDMTRFSRFLNTTRRLLNLAEPSRLA